MLAVSDPYVTTGASLTGLEGRISDLQAMTARHPLVAAPAREVPLGAAVLEDLEQHGPAPGRVDAPDRRRASPLD